MPSLCLPPRPPPVAPPSTRSSPSSCARSDEPARLARPARETSLRGSYAVLVDDLFRFSLAVVDVRSRRRRMTRPDAPARAAASLRPLRLTPRPIRQPRRSTHRRFHYRRAGMGSTRPNQAQRDRRRTRLLGCLIQTEQRLLPHEPVRYYTICIRRAWWKTATSAAAANSAISGGAALLPWRWTPNCAPDQKKAIRITPKSVAFGPKTEIAPPTGQKPSLWLRATLADGSLGGFLAGLLPGGRRGA